MRNHTNYLYDGGSFNISYIPGAPPNMEWPVTNTFTEGQAYTICSGMLWKSLNIPKICIDKMKSSDIEGVISKCVADIKVIHSSIHSCISFIR